MTNDSTKYNRIARLIADWYDGSANREEELEIINFFRTTDPASMPESLRREADVFATIGDLSAECPDKELLAEIDAAVAQEKSAARPRRRPVLRLVAAAVAASVAVLLIVGLGTDSHTQLIAEAQLPSPTPTDYDDDYIALIDSVVVVDEPEPANEAPETHLRTPRHEKRAEPTRTVADATPADEAAPTDYIDINDPEEAARILEEVNRHYSHALAMTTKAIIQTDNALDTTRDIILSVIENS